MKVMCPTRSAEEISQPSIRRPNEAGRDRVSVLAGGRGARAGCVPGRYSAVPTMHEAILLEAEKKGKDLVHSLKLMRNCSAALLPPVSKRFLKAFGENLGQPCALPSRPH